MKLFHNTSNIFQRSDCILNRIYRRQLLATLTVNILAISHGIATGWLSPVLPKLQSTDSPLDFPVSISEASWIGSLLGLGSMFGSLAFVLILDKVGRKICLYITAVPHICLWILIYCAQSVEYLYVGRFMGGLSVGCMYVILPLFVSEIADTRIRGTLSSFFTLSLSTGILIGYILSTHLSYHLLPLIIVVLPIVYLLGVLILPETPQHLLREGEGAAALKSFEFYKNYGQETTYNELQQYNEEFGKLKAFVSEKNQGNDLSYTDFLTKNALKAIPLAAVLLCGHQFSGIFSFISYMSNIFAATGSSLDANTCTIIIGAVQIFGCYTSLVFVDRFGRKVLMLISSGCLILGLVAFGVFVQFSKSGFLWVPLLLMIFIVFIANVGVIGCCFTILVEIFPPKIRSVGMSTSMVVLSTLVFLMLKIFPIVMHNFGIAITMWSCAALSSVCFIYLLIFLPETKGKSMLAD